MTLSPNDYFEGRRCCVCRGDGTYIKNTGNPLWHTCVCGKDDCAKWLCDRCYKKYDPNSYNNIVKLMRKHRNKQLDRYTSSGKDFIGEMIVANTLKLQNCNLELDNFNITFDLYDDVKYKKIQVKYSSLRYGEWKFSGINEGFDTLFLLCMSKDYKNIERVYIFSKNDTGNRSCIKIIINPSRRAWYEDFRVDEEPYNSTYHNMKIEDCPVLRDDRIPR